VIIPARFYQTKWFALILFFTGIGFIIAIFIFNNRQIRMKEKQKQQYLKLETVRGQMNPHFIFNSLNSINYFIARSDRLSANRYIANFSKLIRSFLNNMSQDYIPLSDEIASIKDYLSLEYLRFGDKFEYEINTESVKEKQHIEVFPGMVQPFIENAIWHGVRGLHHKGFVKVHFEFVDHETLKCFITDDGIGRKLAEQNRHDREERKSRGISLIRERMLIINHLEKRKYRIEIEDLYPNKKECGTKVTIDIPIKNQN
jgi:LytS/YehU family sensor histidine kinase